MKTLITFAISGLIAWFLVNAFDAWYQDKEHRRAAKRRRSEGRYE